MHNHLHQVRISRVVRVVRVSKTLQMTANTLIMSLKPLGAVVALMTLLCFVFSGAFQHTPQPPTPTHQPLAVIGFTAFGKVKYGTALRFDQNNFNNFPNSLFTLLVISTSFEHQIAAELSVAPPYCTPDSQGTHVRAHRAGST